MNDSDGYFGMRLPLELAERIDEIIKSEKYGYKTRAEFVKEAIRDKILRLKELELNDK